MFEQDENLFSRAPYNPSKEALAINKKNICGFNRIKTTVLSFNWNMSKYFYIHNTHSNSCSDPPKLKIKCMFLIGMVVVMWT